MPHNRNTLRVISAVAAMHHDPGYHTVQAGW